MEDHQILIDVAPVYRLLQVISRRVKSQYGSNNSICQGQLAPFQTWCCVHCSASVTLETSDHGRIVGRC